LRILAVPEIPGHTSILDICGHIGLVVAMLVAVFNVIVARLVHGIFLLGERRNVVVFFSKTHRDIAESPWLVQ
jgi:hypothetical protein